MAASTADLRDRAGGSRLGRRPSIGAVLGLAAAAALLLALTHGPDPSGRLGTFVAAFLGLFLEAFPFLLLGVLVSALIEALVSPDRLAGLLPRGRLGAAAAGSVLGLVFPVCECGVIPVGRRLLLKGVPLPLAIAFMLAGPVVNPVVLASTWVAFGGDPLIVGGRVGLTLVVAIAVAGVVGLYPGRPLLGPPALSRSPEPNGERSPGSARAIDWPARAAHAVDELFDVGRYLVFGIGLAAAIQTFVPRGALLALGQDAVSSVAALMALGALLSICSTVDAFVALPFAQVFGPGAVLGFLVLGPMVDVKTALMLSGIFRPRVVVVMLGLATQATFAAALWVNLNVP